MNIVRIDKFDRVSRGKPNTEHARLLRECRTLVADQLSRSLASMLAKVDDALFELAEKAENNAAQSVYFDAMREVRMKRQGMEADFREEFLRGFNAEIDPRTRQARTAPDAEGEQEFDLVEHDDLEEQLAVTNMVTKLETGCREELGALERRMGFLLGDPELEQCGNPVGPRVVCDAFRVACQRIESGIKVRLIVMKLFDRYVVSEDLPKIYRTLNQFLIAKNILPRIRHEIRKRGAPAGGRPAAPGGDALPENDEDLFETIHSLMGAAGGAATGSVAGGVAGSGAGGAFLNTLTLLQQGHGELVPGGIGAFDTAGLAAGNVNIIRDIKSADIAQGMSGGEAMVIDVVAMLFDYILDDQNLPDAMKALIGRLQIPLLKVAMMDKSFFARKNHPARQLLNLLAEAGLGWSGSEEDILYATIDGIVQRILAEFEDDIEIFADSLAELNAFLEAERRQAEMHEAHSTRLMEGTEQLRLAKARVSDEVTRRLGDDDIPHFVQQFLVTYWQNLLLVILVKEGEGSYDWKRAVATMDNLIWSVTPKPDAEERARVVRLLPGLIGLLREGMEQVSMDQDEAERFIEELSAHHGRVVNNEHGDASPVEADPLAHLDDETEQAETIVEDVEVTTATIHRLVRECDLEVGEIDLGDTDSEDDAEPQVPEACLEAVRGLSVGDWVEFCADEGEPLRAKLTWISPVTGVYLFTNRQGLKAADRTEAALAADLHAGRVRFIETTPLVERAVSHLVQDLKQQAEAG